MVNPIYTPLQTPAAYTLGERLLRTIYYERSVLGGFFERCIIWLYKLFAKHVCEPVLDLPREERGLFSLERLGAVPDSVTPLDELAHIQMMTLSSREFEAKLTAFGGRWEKLRPSDSSNTILAIIPPEAASPEWTAFEKDCLRLKWEKQTVNGQEVIVTCSNADAINESDFHTKLFLHANSASVTFSMLTRRWGFYLGCKQSICAYNPRGCAGSTGVASEAGHYNDIQAVYDKIKTRHDPRHIWLSSACGGGPAVAYLTSKNPELTHWIFENGFTRLQDCIELQSPLARRLARNWMGGLRSRDIPEEHKPREVGYNIESLFEDVPKRDGTIIIARVINDHVLPREIHERNLALASRVCSSVQEVFFTSTRTDQNHHIDRFFCHPDAASAVTQVVFGKSQSQS